jgi:periplasmic divalent cation tolerance protein
MNDYLVVLVTTPDAESAEKIASALVEERLAACVNIVPAVKSIYRWEGKVTRDDESLMIIKTTAERYEAAELRIKQLHSYTTPEVIALPLKAGSAAYLEWLSSSTSDDGAL